MKIKSILAAFAILVAGFSITASSASAADLRVDSIDAGGKDSWTLTLSGGCFHRIVMDGDGDTDLDAFLYDENGNLVSSDDDGTDTCILEVSPRWTGQFTLVIRNLGSVYNDYTLVVN